MHLGSLTNFSVLCRFARAGSARVHQGDSRLHLPVQLAHRSGLHPGQNHQLLLQVTILLFPSSCRCFLEHVSLHHLNVCLCFSDGQGHSYDLSPLAMESRNWVVEASTVDTDKQYYINVCRSLVQQGGQCASSRSALSSVTVTVK